MSVSRIRAFFPCSGAYREKYPVVIPVLYWYVRPTRKIRIQSVSVETDTFRASKIFQRKKIRMLSCMIINAFKIHMDLTDIRKWSPWRYQ
jgi:hypothetical protein